MKSELDTYLEDKQDWTLEDFQYEAFIKTEEARVKDKSLVKARALLEGYKEENKRIKDAIEKVVYTSVEVQDIDNKYELRRVLEEKCPKTERRK